jgi:hypothetical protein
VVTAVERRGGVGEAAPAGRYGLDAESTPAAGRCAREPVAEARALVAAMSRGPAGHASPSVYETGRLVSLAPWLVHHVQRVEHLLATQRPDGTWGGPQGYALAPTLRS